MAVGVGAAGMVLERRRELRAIDDALAGAGEGRGGLVLVEGPAGIGKSTLLEAAIARARERGLDVVAGRGSELEQPLALGLVRQWLEPAVRRAPDRRLLSGAAAPAAALLGEAAAGPAVAEELELHHALFWLVAGLADRRPLVLVADDLHWADAPSLRFLAYLGRRVPDLAVAVIGAVRPNEPGGADAGLLARLAVLPAARTLPLDPLTADASAAVVLDHFAGADAAFAAAAHRASGGNPFYLHELLRALAADGVEPSAGRSAEIERIAPASVLRTIVVRLDSLPAGSRELARAVAILGEDARLGRAAALAGLDLTRAAAAADALAAVDILRPGEPLAFTHPLLRATLEADVPEAERALTRARAARLLHDHGAPPDRVAAQLLGAPRAGDAWTVRRLREAAADARSRAAPDSAAVYLRRAADEPPPAEERAHVLLELGEAEALAGDPRAIGRFERAVELLPQADERAEALRRLGWRLYEAGRMADALLAFERGLAERAGADDPLAAELRTGQLALSILIGRLSPEELHERTRAALDAARGAGARARRELFTQLALARVFGSLSHGEARAFGRRALDGGRMLEEDGVSLSFSVAVSCLFWADDLETADAAIADALALARRRSSPATAAYVLFGRAQVRSWQGRMSEAAADAGAAVEAWRGGFSMHLASAAHVQALALVELGDLDGAARAVELGRAESRDGVWHVQLEYASMLLAAARGDAEERLRHARRLATEAERNPFVASPASLPWRSEAALAELHAGDRRHACELVHEELRLARRFGAPRPIAVALRAAALVGDDDPVDLLRESIALLEGAPHRLELARSLVTLGALLRSQGRRLEAREPLRRALDVARTLGLRPLRDRARAELEATGARPRREAVTGFDALTPSERRVAELAAAGRSNPEIAQELFVTRKTVEFHLQRAYRKLGIGSRAELPGALRPRG